MFKFLLHGKSRPPIALVRRICRLLASDKRRLYVMLSPGHVQMAVEAHREMEPRHAAWREAIVITRSVSDLV
jgi:hypothetical protein